MDLTPHHAKYYAHDLTRRAASGVDRLSMSLFDASVDLNPHQIEAALFALQSPLSKGVVLADEVGLGKTIEAGIVLCQFWAERKRNLLVICPASIRKQWALELEEKFSLPVAALILRKLLASSSQAIAATLDTLRARLETLRDEQASNDPQLAERLIEGEEIEGELLDEILADDDQPEDPATEPPSIDRQKLREEIDILRQLAIRAREKLEKWADDMVLSAEKALADTKEQIKTLRRQSRQAATQDEQCGIQEKIRKLERQQRRQRQEIFKAEDDTETYDRLYSFFRRYYSEGDFLSKRVYKPGVYAIPYEGEEVKLHWANADQYYIKTSEYLRDYAFLLRPDDAKNPMRVHFRLADAAEGEHGDVKAAEGKERRFTLHRDRPVSVENGELVIRFTYEPDPGKQKELNAAAEQAILSTAGAELRDWLAELGKPHRRPDGTSAGTRLRIHLDRYTGRNTFDYFIHKDLGGFLRRELDFYIKNEVMHLDDIEDESVLRVEQYLSKIKVIRKIAGKIIDFLAQLEDFQKKLWLKKKFVVETQWCILVGSIPEAFYTDIAANDAQREEWVGLYAIDEILGDLTTPGYSVPLTSEFLKANPTLVVDTRHFPEDLTARLLDAVGDVDDQTDGVLVHSENFQSLLLMQAKTKENVDTIYIDPPYNTDAGPIAYKNGYRHSSWLALIDSRLELTRRVMTEDAIMCVTIDDVEAHNLRTLLEGVLPEHDLLGAVAIKNNPAGRTGTVGFSICHEYALFYGRPGLARVGRLDHSEAQKARYKERDGIGAFEWTNFRKHGGLNTYRTARPRQFYPIYVHGDDIRIPNMEWDNSSREWIVLESPEPGEEVLLPIDEAGRERIWDFVADTAREQMAHLRVRKDARDLTAVYRKWRLNDEGFLPQTLWDKSEYSAAEYGTNLLAHIFGETHTFTFPKSLHAVVDCLRVANLRSNTSGCALDYYAGSGTTGHAVINLNREDGGRRKFILVEMGDYFDTVLLPRLKKVTFTPEWKDGKPKRLATTEEAERSPRIMKVVRLESYEDTLNNLDTRRTKDQQSLLDLPAAQGADGLKEQYLLRYMLKDSEFDLIYVNGDNNLENLKQPDDTWKVRIIEEDFHRLMFEMEGA